MVKIKLKENNPYDKVVDMIEINDVKVLINLNDFVEVSDAELLELNLDSKLYEIKGAKVKEEAKKVKKKK